MTGGSVIWEIENWSILRQSVTHLIICSVTMFPVAYFMAKSHIEEINRKLAD